MVANILNFVGLLLVLANKRQNNIVAMLFDFNNCYCLEIKIAKILIAILREKNSFIFLLTLLGLSRVFNRLIAARQLSTQGG